jgi:hypothetical protein
MLFLGTHYFPERRPLLFKAAVRGRQTTAEEFVCLPLAVQLILLL